MQQIEEGRGEPTPASVEDGGVGSREECDQSPAVAEEGNVATEMSPYLELSWEAVGDDSSSELDGPTRTGAPCPWQLESCQRRDESGLQRIVLAVGGGRQDDGFDFSRCGSVQSCDNMVELGQIHCDGWGSHNT